MIVNYLILMMCTVALLQPTPARLKVAGVFSGAALLHCVIGEQLDGGAYYISAAVLDSAIITIT